MTDLLLGKPVADCLAEKIKKELSFQKNLKLVTVGFDEPQWLQYVNSLKSGGECLGISVKNIILNEASVQVFDDTVKQICTQNDVSGVLLQQPLPYDFAYVCEAVCPAKDVDCINSVSRLKLYLSSANTDVLSPATPSAVLHLLDFYGIDVLGKHVAVVGRGNSVGKPLSQMLLRRNATVTVCHSKTTDLPHIVRSADIIVSACGVGGLITADCVTKNSIVIDVGLSFKNGKTCGDVSREVYEIAAAVSPVPGGVGPITRMSLFENLLRLSVGTN